MAKEKSGNRKTYSLAEARELLGVGTNSIYRAAARGEIPTIRIGGRILVPKAALDRLLEPAG